MGGPPPDSDFNRERKKQINPYASISHRSTVSQELFDISFSPTANYDKQLYTSASNDNQGSDAQYAHNEALQIWQFEPSSRVHAEPNARAFSSTAPASSKLPQSSPQTRTRNSANRGTLFDGSIGQQNTKSSTQDITPSLKRDLPNCVAMLLLGVLCALLFSVFSFIINLCIVSGNERNFRRLFFSGGCFLGCIGQAVMICLILVKVVWVKKIINPAG